MGKTDSRRPVFLLILLFPVGVVQVKLGKNFGGHNPWPDNPVIFAGYLLKTPISSVNKFLINALKYLLGAGIGAFFLYLVFKDADPVELWAKVKAVDVKWILFSITVGLASHFLRSLRWGQQMEASGYKPGALRLFAAVMTGYMVNVVIPRAGEFARCGILLKSDKVPVTTALGTVVISRVFDVLILFGLLGLVLLLEYDTILRMLNLMSDGTDGQSGGLPIWLWVAAGLGAVGAVVAWIFRKQLMTLPLVKKVIDMVLELWRGALSIRNIRRPWLFVLYTIGIWVGYISMTYIGFFSMQAFEQVEMNLLYLSFVTTMIGGIGIAFPAPGGTGAYHFAVQMIFTALLVMGTPEDSKFLGQTFAIVMHSTQILMMVIVGLIGYVYLILAPQKDSKINPEGNSSVDLSPAVE